MIGIVVSTADAASEHIGERLLEECSWEQTSDTTQSEANGGGTVYHSGHFELRTFDALHLEMPDVAAAFTDPDVVVFASRHSGDSGPLLTAHHTGNFGAAEYGGASRSLATAAPQTAAAAIAELDRYAPEQYEVSLEATHHGPTSVGVPSLFIELGSDTEQWTDPAGATAVAKAILSLPQPVDNHDRSVVGIGGSHYAPRCTRIVRETDWAVGHVAPDWGLAALEEPAPPVLHQLFDKSDTTRFVVDGEYPVLTERLETLGYDRVSETWLRETTGVAGAVVDRLMSAFPDDAVVRFGVPAQDAEPTVAVEVSRLPEPLVETARNIDQDAVVAAFRDTLLAFCTAPDTGALQSTVVAAADQPLCGAVPAPLVGAFRRILTERYDTVTVDGEALIATRTVFDPDQAKAHGVPEGPMYGLLADGESVDIDGRTVDPTTVHKTVRDEFPLTAAGE